MKDNLHNLKSKSILSGLQENLTKQVSHWWDMSNDLDEQTKSDYETILTLNNKILKTLLALLGIHIPKAM